MKNFRDKWVGSSEGNLEKIFRLIHALGRCYVFIDEADQALGRRDSASGDSGVGGRIYSMLAEEIGGSTNRGRVIWVLASSRPDLIEVDLKCPGRVDVKIPLFPTTTPREGFDLIRMLCGKRGLAIRPFRGRDRVEMRRRSLRQLTDFSRVSGAPGEIRTPDPLLRRQTLYPTELRAHCRFDSKAFTVPTDTLLRGSTFRRRGRRSSRLSCECAMLTSRSCA